MSVFMGVCVSIAALLACSSVEAKRLPDPTLPIGLGNWSLLSTPDAMTDEKNYFVSTNDFGLSSWFYVSVSCEAGSNTLTASFFVKKMFGEGRSDLVYRVDKQAPVTLRAAYTKEIIELDQRDVHNFLNAIRAGKTLAVRTQNYDGEITDHSVDINGAPRALDKLKRSCNAKAPRGRVSR
jgi:hypothetical protein